MIRKLFETLAESGVNVYFPAKKTGKCTEPYAVIKEEKTVPGTTGRSVTSHFTVSVIVPLDNYRLLSTMEKNIISILKKTPFKYRGTEERQSDDEINAYIRDLSYTVIKRNL